MLISTTVIRRKKKFTITNKHTNWERFREELDKLIDLKVKLKSNREVDDQVEGLVGAIRKATKIATLMPKNITVQDICYPMGKLEQ